MKQSSKVDLPTVRYAHQLTRDAFMAGVEWILESLKDSHTIEMDEEFLKEIHQAATLVIDKYQETVEEGLGIRVKSGEHNALDEPREKR